MCRVFLFNKATNEEAGLLRTLCGECIWSLVIGHWSLVIGHWSLVIGHSVALNCIDLMTIDK